MRNQRNLAPDPADPDSLVRTVERGKTRVLWMESPRNPTWDVIDIEDVDDLIADLEQALA